jgi:hypothetical protein
VALIISDVLEVRIASTIKVTRIGKLGTLAVTNRNTRRRNTEPHGVTSQKTAFFIVTAVKTSNLT